MGRYVARRLLLAIPVLLGASFIVFALVYALPGDPIVVETAESWFVYRVLGNPATGDLTTDPTGIPGRQIVRPEAIEVISPTPGADGSLLDRLQTPETDGEDDDSEDDAE